jgi:hypothetical protein
VHHEPPLTACAVLLAADVAVADAVDCVAVDGAAAAVDALAVEVAIALDLTSAPALTAPVPDA